MNWVKYLRAMESEMPLKKTSRTSRVRVNSRKHRQSSLHCVPLGNMPLLLGFQIVWQSEFRTGTVQITSVQDFCCSGIESGGLGRNEKIAVMRFLQVCLPTVSGGIHNRSSDLSPCDFFLWGCLKAEVLKSRPRTLEALMEAIREDIAGIPHDTLETVMGNFRERLPSLVRPFSGRYHF